MNPFKRLSDWEAKWRAHYNSDLSTPENRRKAGIYNMWFDHEVFRYVFANQHEISPGVFRSNHPTRGRFEKLKAKGIKTILNLRGTPPAAHYLLEEEACREVGLNLVSVGMKARSAPRRERILATIEAFQSIEKPFVMHCKSGADRAGFASAIYLLVIEGRSLAEARKMLSFKYLHIRRSRTGILDHILDLYEERTQQGEISFEDWIRDEYDPPTVQQDFQEKYKPWF